MNVLDTFFELINTAVVAVILGVIALMVVRLIINFADPNPFSRPVITLRRVTDPLVAPVRGWLMRFGMNVKIAPLFTILLAILFGYFVLLLATSIQTTIVNVSASAASGNVVRLIGSLLYGAIDLYSLLMIIYIILSWGGRGNRVVRFLARICEPLLAPLRRVIPPLGGFDLSPLILFLIIFPLLKAAIAKTLLS